MVFSKSSVALGLEELASGSLRSVSGQCEAKAVTGRFACRRPQGHIPLPSCRPEERTFDVGIAEQHAVTFAAGLAAGGLSAFLQGKQCKQCKPATCNAIGLQFFLSWLVVCLI